MNNLLDQIIAKYPYLQQIQNSFGAGQQPGADKLGDVVPPGGLPQSTAAPDYRNLGDVMPQVPGFTFAQVVPRKPQQQQQGGGGMDMGSLAKIAGMLGFGG